MQTHLMRHSHRLHLSHSLTTTVIFGRLATIGDAPTDPRVSILTNATVTITTTTTTINNATGCGAPLSTGQTRLLAQYILRCPHWHRLLLEYSTVMPSRAGSGFTFNAINGIVNFVSTFPG